MITLQRSPGSSNTSKSDAHNKLTDEPEAMIH